MKVVLKWRSHFLYIKARKSQRQQNEVILKIDWCRQGCVEGVSKLIYRGHLQIQIISQLPYSIINIRRGKNEENLRITPKYQSYTRKMQGYIPDHH